jgi:hypothetical protein
MSVRARVVQLGKGLRSQVPSRRAVSAMVLAVAAVCEMNMIAQQPSGSKTGNPTPGTPQPDPPNLADRITLTGCVQRASAQGGGRSAGAVDANNPSDARFVLVKAERVNVVPPDTGASAAAAAAASQTYRLHGLDSQLSPFVGTRVEISGEVLPRAASAAAGSKAIPPVLSVEFVQKLSPGCQ